MSGQFYAPVAVPLVSFEEGNWVDPWVGLGRFGEKKNSYSCQESNSSISVTIQN